MWKSPDEDPGGGSKRPPPEESSDQTYIDLKDQYDQSQLLLAQLKEMMRKTEQTNLTPEKFELYANTLTRAKRTKQKKGSEAGEQTTTHRTTETPATEKINLMRQQLEENKAKFAERGKSQKGIEEMVIQLKAQMDDSQLLINQAPLNISLIESKVEYSKNSSSEELYNILLNKERYITDLCTKVQKLEGNVLDLQENVKEKDAVIDARTKAITLMTESLTKKGKSTLDTLDETKEQMRKMQETFVTLEADMKARQLKLLDDLKQKNIEIAKSQEIISNLEEDKKALENQLKEQEGTNEHYGETQGDEPKCSVKKYLEQISDLKAKVTELEEKLTKNETTKKTDEPDSGYNEKIAELQKSLDDEIVKNKELTKKNNDQEAKIKQLNITVRDLQNKKGIEKQSDNGDEVAKLKKQLEEHNKNMIKVKAQHKSKVKELNKKIDAFKKISDTNAEIVRLEAENGKLQHKIAELEEEKGNLQLKLVETDSSKDSSSTEQIEELSKNLTHKLTELEEKDESIKQLEIEIQSSKAEVQTLNEKLSNLSHLQNVQVTSEMKSIQYEEELENEKKQLAEERDRLAKENAELMERIEVLKKEKQELNIKLDNYMQENMELIDKLEKLSTEKVSSAESIEIVEGLTQQEKLEIEQLQKNLDITSGNLKVSEENLLQSPDLNESVNQLTEETSELLQKIELFTVERREVMEKMELLTNENNNLNLKLKEIENNRDVLAETYEQLQNEKECLDNKIEALERENGEMKRKLQINDTKNESEDESEATRKVYEKLSNLEKDYDELAKENQCLKVELKRNMELVHEKDAIEVELRKAKEKIETLEKEINVNTEELNNYLNVIEQNKNELISSAELINTLQNKLDKTENDLQQHKFEIAQLNSIIADLNNAIMNLENENQNNTEVSETVEKELSELKTALDDQIQQAKDYEQELECNSETINSLNKELKTLTNKIYETENLLDSKDDEIKKLTKERDNKETIIQDLHKLIKEKDEAFHTLKNELQQKYMNIQKRMEANTGTLEDIKVPFQNTIAELTNKNKEQLEKIKKFAANLKKKNLQYHELEGKFNEITSNLERRNKEYSELEQTLKDQFNYQETFAKEKFDLITKYEEQLSNLNQQIEELARKNAELQSHSDIVLLENLKEELSSSISDDDIASSEAIDINYFKSKIRELKTIKTNQRGEIGKYKEKINDLEENIALTEENCKDLELKISELEKELDEKNFKFMELAESENALVEKMTELATKLETTEKRIRDLEKERDENILKAKELEDLNDKLKHSLAVAQDKVSELSNAQTGIVEAIEQENKDLRNRTLHLENQLKEVQMFSEIQKVKAMEEIDALELDWQQQSTVLVNEKMEMNIQLEKLTDQCFELTENNTTLKEEVDELKVKLEEKKTELENMKSEYQVSLNTTEQMHSQFAILQGENENLKANMDQFNQQVSVYQQQIQQLQSENSSLLNQLMSASSNQNNEMAILYNELNKQLEDTTFDKQQLVVQLDEVNRQLFQATHEIDVSEAHLKHSNDEIESLKQKLASLKDATLKEALKETAVQTIDSIITEAVEKTSPRHITRTVEEELLPTFDFVWSQHQASEDVSDASPFNAETSVLSQSFIQHEQVPVFNWQQQSTTQTITPTHTHAVFTQPQLFETQENYDPFAFVVDPNIQQSSNTSKVVAGVNKPENVNTYNIEELLEKIKSLEFMLHNTEKEKNEALSQCNQFSNEIIRLVYEREQSGTSSAQPGFIDIDVVDTTIVKKTVSFPEGHEASKKSDCELQIVSDSDIGKMSSSRKDLESIEFQQAKPCVGPSRVPVTEEQVEPKSAYLCYKKGKEKSTTIDAFAEDDDGWGFSPDDARLEEEHIQRTESSDQNVTRITEDLKDKIRVLEVERENHLEEIKQLQIKSGKLIKKLKELKQRSERINAQPKKTDDFFSLDNAIQEELTSQVEQLEKKIKDLNAEVNKEKTEKASLAKRIDVLTSANERMIEMKEKQDVEMMCWQRKNYELAEKLKQFEWGGDGFGVSEHKKEVKPETSEKPTEKTVKELQNEVEVLNKTLKELTLDKEELQALLDEQTALRLDAEKNKPIPQVDYMDLISEKNDLSDKLKESQSQKRQLQEAYDILVKDNEVHQQRLFEIEETNNILNQLTIEKNHLLEDLNNKMEALQLEYSHLQSQQTNAGENLQTELQQQIESISCERDQILKELQDSKHELSMVKEEKDRINQQLQERDRYISDLQQTFEVIAKENEHLRSNSTNNEDFVQRIEKLCEENELLSKLLEEKSQEVISVRESLDDQTISLRNKLDTQIETTQSLLEQLDSQQKNTDYEELKQQLDMKNLEISQMVEHLTTEWEARVNQRGADVAESWKLHLETRESEFSQLEQLLRQEIAELEEKCSTLVNENNELRKMVDTKIRNEDDRVTTQISDGQQMVDDLTRNLQDKQHEIERLQNEIANYEAQVIQLNQLISEKDNIIVNQVADEETIRAEFNDNQEIVRSIVLKLQEKCGVMLTKKDDVINEFDKQISESWEKDGEIRKLQENLNQTVSHDELEKREEEVKQTNVLSQELKLKLNDIESKKLDLEGKLQNRDQEITSLNNKLLDLEKQKVLENNKFTEMGQNLVGYQQQLENVNIELQEKRNSLENLAGELQNAQLIISQKDDDINNLRLAIDEKEQQIAYLTENMNLHNNSLTNEYLHEINNLKKQLVENEMRYEELIIMKENDLQLHKMKIGELEQKVNETTTIQAMLEAKEIDLINRNEMVKELELKLNEQNVLLEDEHKQLTELREIIEGQVFKIEELKKELFAKSNDYDSLIAEMDMRRNLNVPSPEISQSQANVASAASPVTIPQRNVDDDDLAETVSHAKYDLALYMLHQRDVRCEELAVELTHLLEERDTLQLRLSYAIREKEELKRRYQADTSMSEDESIENVKTSPPKGSIAKSKSAQIVLGATGTEVATEATETLLEGSENVLQSKLSELKSVSYKKDKTIVDEQDLRRLQQFSIMQQHSDVVSRLPPEAAARLVDASYTLSRDVQSPSKVLLNWLWGTSTPKVNNI